MAMNRELTSSLAMLAASARFRCLRHSSEARSLRATLNYSKEDIIRLAQTDAAAASNVFWKPLSDYRELMTTIGIRHAQEELGLSPDRFVASVKAESHETRRARLSAFGTFFAALTARGDPDAAAATEARR